MGQRWADSSLTQHERNMAGRSPRASSPMQTSCCASASRIFCSWATATRTGSLNSSVEAACSFPPRVHPIDRVIDAVPVPIAV